MIADPQILLLEDDMIQTMLFRASVDGVLGTVVNFTDLSDAFTLMDRSPADLCVVDLGVFSRPGTFEEEGGNTFITMVRQKVSRTIPIIVATSGRDPETLLSSFRAGADDYVLKDEGLDKVIDRIKLWLEELPVTKEQLDIKRSKILGFLEAARKNKLDLPE